MLDMQSPAEFRAGVPETALVRLQHPALFDGQEKIGSLQRFRANRGGAEDWGAPSFSRKNVQNIALFDLLTLNLDRHGGNMLVSGSKRRSPSTRRRSPSSATSTRWRRRL